MSRRNAKASCFVGVCCGLLLLLTAGCGQTSKSLPVQYGQRAGSGAASVNGTRALSELFRQAGFSVRSYRSLSPGTLRHDVIVWVPDSFVGPSDEVRETILNWLDEVDGRTFVYIGRDFDAEIQYWDQVLDQLPAADRLDALRKRAEAVRQFDQLRNNLPEKSEYTLFTMDHDEPERRGRKLTGPWADGVDSSKANIVLRSRMEPAEPQSLWDHPDADEIPYYMLEDQEVLLAADGEAVAVWMGSDYSESQLILINNGSFLLNLPLVNPAHRQLAARLVEESTSSYGPTSVAFLETGDYVQILEADDSNAGTSGWEWLEKWPLNMVGLQLAWWLIVLCVAYYPIFGRAKHLPRGATSDFKKHIDSVAGLLLKTGDEQYAQLRVQQYQHVMKGEAVYRRSRTRRADVN